MPPLRQTLRHPEVRAKRASKGDGPIVAVGVDHDLFTRGDEGRHHDAQAVFEFGRLVGRGCGLPFDDGIGLDDFERDVIRQLDADRALVVQFERHRHAVLQEGRAFADEILVQFGLLVGVVVHEHQALALAVQELEILLLEAHALDLFVGAEPVVELATVDQVFQLDLIIGRALAGLDCHGFD
jgi:hypothetical protein